MTGRRFGLCDGCAQQRLVRSGRGVEYSLCERSFGDRRFPKYPPTPVLRCSGFEARSREPSADGGEG